ncbi:unnamed protein product [Durusdinium trenchii]|uniref:Protein kinase domain-containing protein n=1 Tax=Durusdinium trenchii TaxID=1381693 RepID=A0ABP0J114_9DINO
MVTQAADACAAARLRRSRALAKLKGAPGRRTMRSSDELSSPGSTVAADDKEVKAKQEENGEQGKTDAKKAANQEKKPDHKEEGNKKGKTDESQIQEKNGGKREPHQDEKAKCEKTEDKDKEHTPPAVSPGPSGTKALPEVKRLAERARSGGKQSKTRKLQLLFEQWVSASEKWSSSSLVISMKQRHQRRHKGGRRWLTKAQIAIKYNSKELAEEICHHKESDEYLRSTETKPFPDKPGLLLYLVWDEEYVSEERDEVLEQLYELRDDSEPRQSKKDKKNESGKSKRKSESMKAAMTAELASWKSRLEQARKPLLEAFERDEAALMMTVAPSLCTLNTLPMKLHLESLGKEIIPNRRFAVTELRGITFVRAHLVLSDMSFRLGPEMFWRSKDGRLQTRTAEATSQKSGWTSKLLGKKKKSNQEVVLKGQLARTALNYSAGVVQDHAGRPQCNVSWTVEEYYAKLSKKVEAKELDREKFIQELRARDKSPGERPSLTVRREAFQLCGRIEKNKFSFLTGGTLVTDFCSAASCDSYQGALGSVAACRSWEHEEVTAGGASTSKATEDGTHQSRSVEHLLGTRFEGSSMRSMRAKAPGAEMGQIRRVRGERTILSGRKTVLLGPRLDYPTHPYTTGWGVTTGLVPIPQGFGPVIRLRPKYVGLTPQEVAFAEEVLHEAREKVPMDQHGPDAGLVAPALRRLHEVVEEAAALFPACACALLSSPLLPLPCFLPERWDKLGGGGFAIVCRGRFGAQQVVLKVLKQQTEEFAKQLKHEARTMLLCACPHVVTLIGTVGPCILMEPMECDLRPSLQRAVATPNTCSRGTRHSHGPGAHAAGHSPQGCDILASNQDPPFTTKLADFGLAVHTRAGMLSEPVGTLPFMADDFEALPAAISAAEAVGVEVSELRFARAVLQQRKELRRTKASEAARGITTRGCFGLGILQQRMGSGGSGVGRKEISENLKGHLAVRQGSATTAVKLTTALAMAKVVCNCLALMKGARDLNAAEELLKTIRRLGGKSYLSYLGPNGPVPGVRTEGQEASGARSSTLRGLVQKHWGTFSPEVQEAFKEMGLQQMAEEPDLTDPTYVAYKFKTTSGQLRALGQKKLQLEQRETNLQKQLAQVVAAKEQLLDRLQTCHQDMEEISQHYAQIVLQPKGQGTSMDTQEPPEIPSGNPEIQHQMETFHALVSQLGSKVTTDDKQRLLHTMVRVLEDAGQKKRKTNIQPPQYYEPGNPDAYMEQGTFTG